MAKQKESIFWGRVEKAADYSKHGDPWKDVIDGDDITVLILEAVKMRARIAELKADLAETRADLSSRDNQVYAIGNRIAELEDLLLGSHDIMLDIYNDYAEKEIARLPPSLQFAWECGRRVKEMRDG